MKKFPSRLKKIPMAYDTPVKHVTEIMSRKKSSKPYENFKMNLVF